MGIFKKEETTQKKSVAAEVTRKKAKKSEKKPETAKKATAKKKQKMISKEALSVILKPLVSEKSAHLSEDNVLVLHVAPRANKVQIKQAFHELYKVMPESVNIINVRGKSVRFGRTRGKRSDYKKAMIRLPKGTSVDIFEGV